MLVEKGQMLGREGGHRQGDSITHTERRDRKEAGWPEFNNALVCHTWTEFVGQISIEGQRSCKRGRDGDMQAKQIGCSSLLRPPNTWE